MGSENRWTSCLLINSSMVPPVEFLFFSSSVIVGSQLMFTRLGDNLKDCKWQGFKENNEPITSPCFSNRLWRQYGFTLIIVPVYVWANTTQKVSLVGIKPETPVLQVMKATYSTIFYLEAEAAPHFYLAEMGSLV